jgi:LSD1 subclass zinc finger protein
MIMAMESTVPVNATTCPECRGPLSFVPGSIEFRCLVGHAYSPWTLLWTHYETQERTLWSAVVVLEEAAILVDAVSPYCSGEIAEHLRIHAAGKLKQAKSIRNILEQLEPFRTEGGGDGREQHTQPPGVSGGDR